MWQCRVEGAGGVCPPGGDNGAGGRGSTHDAGVLHSAQVSQALHVCVCRWWCSLVPSPYFQSDFRSGVGMEIGTGYEASGGGGEVHNP